MNLICIAIKGLKNIKSLPFLNFREYVTEPSIRFASKGSSVDRIPWTQRGGVGRDHDTLMELQLTKVRQVNYWLLH